MAVIWTFAIDMGSDLPIRIQGNQIYRKSGFLHCHNSIYNADCTINSGLGLKINFNSI